MSAVYYNGGDLGLGREMHCLKNQSRLTGTQAACYVSNYGSATDKLADSQSALQQYVDGSPPAATVAMEFDSTATDNPVKFFVYGAGGSLVNDAELDTGGPKPVPGVCLTCHGGTYSTVTNSVTSARFLPFDVDSFGFHPALPAAAQQESFRQLNAVVAATSPGALIDELVHGWHGQSLDQPFDGTFIPQGWDTDRASRTVYQKAFRPYCQTCHIAQGFNFPTYEAFKGLGSMVRDAVCGNPATGATAYMPQAEITFEKFRASPARAHVAGGLGLFDDCDGFGGP